MHVSPWPSSVPPAMANTGSYIRYIRASGYRETLVLSWLFIDNTTSFCYVSGHLQTVAINTEKKRGINKMIHLGKQLFQDVVQPPTMFGHCKVMLRHKSKTFQEDKKLNVHVYFQKFKLGKGIT